MSGFNLPPGCSSNDIDRAFGCDIPVICEDKCPYFDEKLGDNKCPFPGHEDMCPTLSLVTKCDECGKALEIPIVRAAFKAGRVVCGIHDNIFCCSDECAKKAQDKTDEIAKELSGDIEEE